MVGWSLGCALVVFVGVAAALGVAGRAGRDTAELWRLWRYEFALVAWIGVPAALGPATWGLALAITAGVGVRELGSARGAPDAWTRVAAAIGALVVVGAALHPVVGLALGAAWAVVALPVPGHAAPIAAFSLAGAVALATLSHLGNRFGDAVFLFAVVELHDTAATVVGQLAGRRRLAPRISPRKTVEGAVAGLLAATLAGAAFSPLVPELGPAIAGAAALGLGLGALAADLATSAWKRSRGLKDFGAHLPVHGSVLDVYDSLLLTAPAWALALAWLRW